MTSNGSLKKERSIFLNSIHEKNSSSKFSAPYIFCGNAAYKLYKRVYS